MDLLAMGPTDRPRVISPDDQIQKGSIMNHIEWESRTGVGRSGWSGSVNGRRLFSIEMSISRTSTWVLRTTLPFSIKSGLDLNKDAEPLKALAERVLTKFITSLGAEWSEAS